MSKVQFKSCNHGQTVLFPSRLDERIPQDSPVRLINRIVEGLDLRQLIATYESGGTTPYNPRMLLKVVFYACMNNICSCRRIASAMERDIHYMWLSGGQYPSFSTINRFRSKHIKECVNHLFVQVVEVLAEMGQVAFLTSNSGLNKKIKRLSGKICTLTHVMFLLPAGQSYR